jgi:hypothetical protein
VLLSKLLSNPKTVVKRNGQILEFSDLVSDVNRPSGADSIATFIWLMADDRDTRTIWTMAIGVAPSNRLDFPAMHSLTRSGIGVAFAVLVVGTILVLQAFDRASHSASDTLRPFRITMAPAWAVSIAGALALLHLPTKQP